jgi:uncharacterized membrane protein YbhN (UPF0104 family)
LLAVIIGGVALWLATRGVSWGAVTQALASANIGFILLAVGAIFVALLLKAWRWQLLYFGGKVPAFSTLFWSMMAGQLINLSPIRLGEIARIMGLEQDTPGIKAQSLGTIVVEKSIHALFILLTFVVLLPFFVLPDWVRDSVITFVILTLVVAIALYAIAYRPNQLIKVARWGLGFLPASIAPRLDRFMVAGLEGLSALRNGRQNLLIVLASLAIAFVEIMPAFFLYRAFHLPLGIAAAALMHVGLTLGMTPPSTPAKVFVFEAFTKTILLFLGIANESIALSYAFTFHLIVILPQIFLGIYAIGHFDWNLRQMWRGNFKG